MPENPKIENEREKETVKMPVEKPVTKDDSSWEKDQRKRSYYYDDSYGYEKYDPAENEENTDDD